jgi:hypothetical protein
MQRLGPLNEPRKNTIFFRTDSSVHKTVVEDMKKSLSDVKDQGKRR